MRWIHMLKKKRADAKAARARAFAAECVEAKAELDDFFRRSAAAMRNPNQRWVVTRAQPWWKRLWKWWTL